ncbi:hypothetical protein G3R41_09030 [Modestobacter muralis]|uniref:Aminoglycoside phosphotransferase family protein n=1 Tax=Modestobacter muralis TaxID=1608614 RepID=A0A6P0H5U7_9ACTN|nr:hypothetical protein [Modestobacter muralis]NEN51081.1 hypothetical protein [Modestobacter muralis]
MTGEGPFGHPGRPDLCARTWPEAIRWIVDALLDDAVRYSMVLPLPSEVVRERLHAAAAGLGAGTTPVRVHLDLSDANVVVDLQRSTPQVTEFNHHERAFRGDPAADLVPPALLGDVAEDADLLAG